jgi:hemerythrin
MKAEPIEWKEEYSVGNEEIDAQHKGLFEIVNNFIEAYNEGETRKVLLRTLMKLIEYTGYHFASEEALMELNGYPKYEEHVKQHKELINGINEVFEQIKSGDKEVDDKVLKLIKSWLINHVMKADKQYMPYLSDKK